MTGGERFQHLREAPTKMQQPPQRFKHTTLQDAQLQPSAYHKCAFLKDFNAFLNVGTGVIMTRFNGETLPTIGRVADIAYNKLEIPALERDDDFQDGKPVVKINVLGRFDVETFRKFNRVEATSPPSRNVPELYLTLDYFWTEATSIEDLAFIFPLEKIDNGAAPVQGMTRGFAIRYGLVGDSMEALKDWNAFPCISIDDKAYDDDDNTNDEEELCYESYARRVFNGIIQVREELRRGLNSSAGAQSILNTQYVSTCISMDTWLFFQRALRNCDVEYRMNEKNKCFKMLYPHLKREKKRRLVRTESFTVRPGESLDTLTKLLGEASTFGMRHKWPKAGDRVALLNVNDTLNVVGSNDCRIEFKLDAGCHLNIAIRYQAVRVEHRNGGPWCIQYPHVNAFIRGQTLSQQEVDANEATHVMLDDDNSFDERDLLTRDTPFDNTEGTNSFVVWDSLPDGRVSVKQDSDGSFHVME